MSRKNVSTAVITAICMVAALLAPLPASVLPAQAAAADILHMDESFEQGYELDTRLSESSKFGSSSTEFGLWGEVVERNNGSGDYAYISTVEVEDGVAMAFHPGDGVASSAQPRIGKYLVPADTSESGQHQVLLSFSLKKGPTGGNVYITATGCGQTRRNVLQVTNTGLSGSSDVSFTPSEWNHFTVLIDYDNWTSDCYINGELAYAGNDIAKSGTVTKDFSRLGVFFAVTFPTNSEVHYTYIDNVKIVELGGTGYAAVDDAQGTAADSIVLSTAAPLDLSSLAGCYAQDDAGNTVAVADAAYLDKDMTRARLTFEQPLSYEASYTLHVDGAADVTGRALAAAIAFQTRAPQVFVDTPALYAGSVSDENLLTELAAGSLVAAAQITNEPAQPMEATLFAALYGPDGGLEDIRAAHRDYAGGESFVLETPPMEVAQTDGRTVRLFLWDNLENGTWLADPVELGEPLPATPEDAAAEAQPGLRQVNIVNLDTKIATLYTTLAAAQPSQQVSLVVRNQESDENGQELSGQDIDWDDQDSVKTHIQYLNAGTTNANGVYTVSFGLQNEIAYLAHALSAQSGEQYQAEFYYVAPEKTEAALQAINAAASAEELYTVIVEQGRALLMDLSQFNNWTQEQQQTVANIMYQLRAEPYATADAANIAFQQAEQIQAIALAETAEQVAEIIASYAEVLQFEAYDAYANVLAEDAVEAVNRAMLDVSASTGRDLMDAFNEAVILSGVQYAENWSQVKTLLADYHEIVGLEADEINDAPSAAFKAIAGNGYSSFSALRSAFESAEREASSSSGSSSSGSSGGGGGGRGSSTSSGGSSFTTTIPPESIVQEPLDPPEDTEPVQSYQDLDSGPWASEAIASLTSLGIVNGKAEGVFAPNDAVTREELLKLLLVGLDLKAEDAQNPFADVADGQWYAPYVAQGYALEIVKGQGDGTFGTGQAVTRQDMAVMVCQAAAAAGMDLPAGEPAGFVDAASIAPYAADAVEAVHAAGLILGMDDGTFAPQAPCTRAQAAQVIYRLLQLD